MTESDGHIHLEFLPEEIQNAVITSHPHIAITIINFKIETITI